MAKNILLVISKFPPEYSGPGVRIPRLYQDIKNDLGIEKVETLCNGIENDNDENYKHGIFDVKRRVASYIRKNKFPFGLLPPRIKNTCAYVAETIITQKELQNYQDKFDLVHIVGHSGGTAAALKWSENMGVPVLMELVNATALPQQKYMLFSKTRPKGKFKVVAISEDLKNKSIAIGFKPDDVWARPNPVDNNIFTPDIENKNSYRSKISPFSNSDIVITSVAKFMFRKNQLFLLDVLCLLPSQYKLILAGPLVKEGNLKKRDEAYVALIKEKIKEYDLTERVHMVFDYVDSADYIKASDVYVLPAWGEGLGTPMLEALCCGVPVVANKEEPAFAQWVTDGDNGFLCDIKEPKAWATAIEAVREVPEEKRRQIAQEIKDHVGQDKIHAQYKEIITNLSS